MGQSFHKEAVAKEKVDYKNVVALYQEESRWYDCECTVGDYRYQYSENDPWVIKNPCEGCITFFTSEMPSVILFQPANDDGNSYLVTHSAMETIKRKRPTEMTEE